MRSDCLHCSGYRKEKLLKVIEDIEEKAEQDVIVMDLSLDKIQAFIKHFEQIEVSVLELL